MAYKLEGSRTSSYRRVDVDAIAARKRVRNLKHYHVPCPHHGGTESIFYKITFTRAGIVGLLKTTLQ